MGEDPPLVLHALVTCLERLPLARVIMEPPCFWKRSTYESMRPARARRSCAQWTCASLCMHIWPRAEPNRRREMPAQGAATGSRGAEGARRHAVGGLGGTGVVDDVVFDVARQTCAQLGVSVC